MKDYFVYLPVQQANSIWGCETTSVGYTAILPGTSYPPQRHPVDHHLIWSKGRVLRGYQIILISEGQGTFECKSIAGSQPVQAPCVLLIFPGVWHRYRPLPETGWVEHWIECQGRVFDDAARAGLICPERSVLKAGLVRDLIDCFQRCHYLARNAALANQDLLSTLGAHLLALLGHVRDLDRDKMGIGELVERAHSLIALRCQKPLNLHALAAELGVSCSHLRHSFKARIGISLREHYLNTRLQKAQDLMVSSSMSIKTISDILGFESPCHFSYQFKCRLGLSPRLWRQNTLQGAGISAPQLAPPGSLKASCS